MAGETFARVCLFAVWICKHAKKRLDVGREMVPLRGERGVDAHEERLDDERHVLRNRKRRR